MTNVPATTDQDDIETVDGLEDLDDSDIVVPRLRIDGNKAVFYDPNTKAEYPELVGVALGLVKGRILWDPNDPEAKAPLCRSVDFDHGLPAPDSFPWETAMFDRAEAEAAAEQAGAEIIELPCASCNLKEWGTDPKLGTAPWCNETHTYPFLIMSEGNVTPVLVQFSKTGITPSKKYAGDFKTRRQPLYSSFTTIKLTAQKKGSVNYAVPTFNRGEDTDPEMWDLFSTQLAGMRAFVRARPQQKSDSSTNVSVGSGSGGGNAVAPPSTPAGGATDEAGDDDEVPF